jgi:hypothetical protein
MNFKNLCLLVVLFAEVVSIASCVPAFAQAASKPEAPKVDAIKVDVPKVDATKAPKKIDRLDLLEIRDLIHQVDALKMQASIAEKKMKELETALQAKFKAISEKYDIGKDDTLNMETGEVGAKPKEGVSNEK